MGVGEVSLLGTQRTVVKQFFPQWKLRLHFFQGIKWVECTTIKKILTS